MRTLAILPIKSFARAKQRLDPEIDPQARRELAEAMLSDVLAALALVASLDGTIVVTAGGRARALAEAHGARVVGDREEGHNAAATLGIEAALEHGAERVLLVPGDCPLLDPAEIEQLLARPAPTPSALIVPDRHGTGTNALLLSPPRALVPSFGPGSCTRHVAHATARGTLAEVVKVPSLALDIDTAEDLGELASRSGRALNTYGLLTRC